VLKYGHLMNSETNWLHGPQTIVTLAWSFISRTIPLAGRWTIKLQDYPIRIIQKQVVENGLADFMPESRSSCRSHLEGIHGKSRQRKVWGEKIKLRLFVSKTPCAENDDRAHGDPLRPWIMQMHLDYGGHHPTCCAEATLEVGLGCRVCVCVCVVIWSFGHLVIY